MKSLLELRHEAFVVRDNGGYNLGAGECNPVIFEDFVSAVFDSFIEREEGLGPVIWEPFAGHTGKSRTQQHASSNGITLISFDLAPSDPEVRRANSTIQGPGMQVDGVFIHPPYYGSTFTSLPGEVSSEPTLDGYVGMVRRTVDLSKQAKGGLLCMVCRKYLHGGVVVDLPQRFDQMLREAGYGLVEVWSSEPDIILLSEKQ